MKMSYSIDERAALVRATWHGVHDPIAVQSRVMNVLDDPRLQPGLNYLSDQRGLDTKPTSVAVETGLLYLEMLLARIGPFKYAILANELDLYTAEQLKYFSERIPQVQVRIFLDESSAENWLGA